MPNPSQRSALFRRRPFLPGGILLGLAFAFIGWDAAMQARHLLRLNASYGVTVDAPAIEPDSPTGYAGMRRSLLLPPRGADTLHWIAQTQHMLASGEWRVREVNYDNAPSGREVHWGSPVRWGLGLLAMLDHAANGTPLGIAVERSTLTAGPLLLAGTLLFLIPLLIRDFSAMAAAVVTLGIVAVYPFYTDFLPGRTDHHGPANLCALFTVLFLLIGVRRGGRVWFAASGMAGAVGLWISAATLTPVLIAIGLSLAAVAWIAREESYSDLAWLDDPGWLRVWWAAGGAVALIAYVVEYFPAHLGWRLEVNHPLYAIAWVGGAEALRVLLLRVRRKPLGAADRIAGSAGALAVSLLPASIWRWGAHTFTVADPFVWRLHALYISEFQSLPWHWRQQGLGWGMIATTLPLALVTFPVARLASPCKPSERALFLLAWGPAAGATILGLWQVRWLSLAFALMVPMLALLLARPQSRRVLVGWTLACILALTPGAALAISRPLTADDTTVEDIRSLADRDLAHWLRQRVGDEPLVIASSPSTTTRMIAYASARGLGTLYWENASGLKRAAEFFGTSSDVAALTLARQAGVTHVVLVTWQAFETSLAKLHRGLPEAAPVPPDSFVARLLGSPVPPAWLRPLPFKLPDHPALAGQHVLIWEVVPEQSRATATANAARHYLEMGQPELAARLLPELAGFPQDLEATLMLAAVAARVRDASSFGPAFQRLLTRLDEASGLDLEGHVHVCVVLTLGQRIDLARHELAAALRKADIRSVRRLTPGTLADLLALSDALQVPWPDAELHTRARQLLPPARRK